MDRLFIAFMAFMAFIAFIAAIAGTRCCEQGEDT
jgi:hypothetical protein